MTGAKVLQYLKASERSAMDLRWWHTRPPSPKSVLAYINTPKMLVGAWGLMWTEWLFLEGNVGKYTEGTTPQFHVGNSCGPWRRMPYGPSKRRELITKPIVTTLNTWTLKSRVTSPFIYTVRTCPNPRLYLPIYLRQRYKFTNRSTLFVTSTFYFIKKMSILACAVFLPA